MNFAIHSKCIYKPAKWIKNLSYCFAAVILLTIAALGVQFMQTNQISLDTVKVITVETIVLLVCWFSPRMKEHLVKSVAIVHGKSNHMTITYTDAAFLKGRELVVEIPVSQIKKLEYDAEHYCLRLIGGKFTTSITDKKKSDLSYDYYDLYFAENEGEKATAEISKFTNMAVENNNFLTQTK